MRRVSLISVLGMGIALAISLVPDTAAAQLGGLLPQCALLAGDCSTCYFLVFLINVGEAALQLIGIVLLASILVGGFFLLISGGNSERIDRGQKTIVGGVIGTVIVFGAYVAVNFIVASFLGNGDRTNVQLFGTDWNQFCIGRLDIQEPYSSCVGVSDGQVCSVGGGECVILDKDNPVCHCYDQKCQLDCTIEDQSSDEVTQSICQESDSLCKESGGFSIGAGKCSDQDFVCCLYFDAVSADTATE